MNKIILIAITCLFFNSAQAQLLAWNFLSDVKGTERSSKSTLTATGLETSVLSRGPGIKAEKSTYSFASAFPINKTKEEAQKTGAYYEFSVRSKTDYILSIERLEVVLRIQKNAPKYYRWMYSTDGVNFTNLGPSDIHSKSTINNGVSQPSLDLTKYPELQNMTSKQIITFRLYAWGGQGDGTETGFRIGKSGANRDALSIYGSVDNKN